MKFSNTTGLTFDSTIPPGPSTSAPQNLGINPAYQPAPCPTCGHCPTCGRGAQPIPAIPCTPRPWYGPWHGVIDPWGNPLPNVVC